MTETLPVTSLIPSYILYPSDIFLSLFSSSVERVIKAPAYSFASIRAWSLAFVKRVSVGKFRSTLLLRDLSILLGKRQNCYIWIFGIPIESVWKFLEEKEMFKLMPIYCTVDRAHLVLMIHRLWVRVPLAPTFCGLRQGTLPQLPLSILVINGELFRDNYNIRVWRSVLLIVMWMKRTDSVNKCIERALIVFALFVLIQALEFSVFNWIQGFLLVLFIFSSFWWYFRVF